MADSVISYEDLIGKDDTFDIIFANIDKLKKELADLATQLQKDLSILNPNEEEKVVSTAKAINELIQAQKALQVEEKKAVKAKKKLNDLTDEELIQREKQKIADRERVQIAKQTAILRSKESGQIEKLRAQLSLTTLQWKKLSKEERENTKEGKALVATKLRLTNQLKQLERATGDARRNVGNYTSSLGKLGKVAAAVFVGRNLASGIVRIANAFGRLIDKNKESNESIKRFSEATGRVSAIFQNIGIAIINVVSEPLTKLINGFEKFTSALFGIDSGSAKASDSVRNLQQEFNNEIETLKRGNLSTEARKQLIDDINKKYKDYLPNLLTEKSSLEDITKAQEQANQAFQKKILILASEEQFIAITKERLDLLREQVKLDQDASKAAENFEKKTKNLNDALKSASISQQDAAINRAQAARIEKSAADAALKANKDRLDALSKEQKELEEVLKQQGINTADLIKNTDKSTDSTKKNTKAVKDNTLAYTSNLEIRIQAIIKVQNQIEKLQAEGIVDQQERLLRLEELRAKAVIEQREKEFSAYIALIEKDEENLIKVYGENSKEVLEFREKANIELLDAEKQQQELSQLQLEESERKKIEIRKKFAIQTIDVVEKTRGTENDIIKKSGEEAVANAQKIQDEEYQKILDGAEKRKEKQKQLLNDITDTANKVGEAIVEIFNKQAELASQLVEDQATAVETQRQRAEQGLSNTLAFEQEQLAQREAEKIRAEKAAKQTAEILALFNLVSAYAASGDSNALAKGLVDFSILKALESGFEEGGYTSDVGKQQIAGVVHGQEYVVTAEDTKKYGLVGKSGADFGEAMSDYFYSPLQKNLYPEQSERFKKNVQNQYNQVSRLENEVREMRRAFERMPKNDFDMVQLTDHFVEISKRVTQNRMSKISKHKKRL